MQGQRRQRAPKGLLDIRLEDGWPVDRLVGSWQYGAHIWNVVTHTGSINTRRARPTATTTHMVGRDAVTMPKEEGQWAETHRGIFSLFVAVDKTRGVGEVWVSG